MNDTVRALLTSLAFLLVTLTGVGADKNLLARRTISVSGTAVSRAAPDLIVWHFQVSDFDKDMLAAKRRNDERLKAILGLRKELGIQENDMETGQVSIHRIYEQDQQGRTGEFKHFQISRTVLVREHDFNRYDEFLEEFVAKAAPEFVVEFQSTRIQEVRAETRLKALQAAREKAAALAKVVGARLGEVLRVDEHWPTTASQGGGGGGGFGGAYDFGAQLEPDVPQRTLLPSDLEVRITIFATFELK